MFRPTELGRIREHLDAPGPAALLVQGERGLGKTTLVRTALRDRHAVWLRGSALPSSLIAREHEARIERLGAPAPGDLPPDPPPRPNEWSGFGSTMRSQVARGALDGVVLVWDRADGLLRDPRWREMLASAWSELRVRARPVHLVLIVRDPPPPDAVDFMSAPGAPLERLHLAPLELRAAVKGFEAWSPLRRLVAYSLLGGEPAIWDRMDPQLRLSTNVVRLLLEPGAPLRSFVDTRYPLAGRNPERALALVHALAHGAREWGELREGTRVFRTSSELGPYIKALRDAGLVSARQSLDSRPGTRNRRYVLEPALLQSWHALFLPRLADLDGGASPSAIWRAYIAPGIPALVARRLPDLVSAYLRRHGQERFHARARETGALWGNGAEIPVAGTLANGAVVYGSTSWQDPREGALDRLGREVAETRYGYGRQSRILALFSARPVAWKVERSVARQPYARLLGPEDLTGNAGSVGE